MITDGFGESLLKNRLFRVFGVMFGSLYFHFLVSLYLMNPKPETVMSYCCLCVRVWFKNQFPFQFMHKFVRVNIQTFMNNFESSQNDIKSFNLKKLQYNYLN